jgi:hypothetical protein
VECQTAPRRTGTHTGTVTPPSCSGMAAGTMAQYHSDRRHLDRQLHGKGCRMVKDRGWRNELEVVELEVIVCAEYSCDRIRPRECVAEEL